jgi:ABC-2 type transport system permease protein
MQNNRLWIVTKFEFKEIVRKPSFWLSTLFLPIFIGLISFVSGYASIEAVDDLQKVNESISKIYIVDPNNVIDATLLQPPIETTNDYQASLLQVKEDDSKILVNIPQDFKESYKYEVIYNKGDKLLTGVTTTPLINALIKQSVLKNIEDTWSAKVLTEEPRTDIKVFDKQGNVVNDGVGQYILPIISLVVFFLTVFISSSFLLQSVSAEKENRMIETMLSIVDKKSLVFGKMIGLTGVVFLQLVLWLGLGLGAYLLGQSYFDLNLPIELGSIDYSLLPVNIFLTITGFIFFAGIMTGVGAVGTGAQDSKNLSSIFIILSIFPMYLMQILITSPSGKLAQFFSYFPFTSHMILLVRNSLGALTTVELILGIAASTIYSAIALWVALKLFELGCLMYNRRPTTKEIFMYFRGQKKL